jgi:dTDP-glucose pyrophosphorylase/predicted transcriptional regulator
MKHFPTGQGNEDNMDKIKLQLLLISPETTIKGAMQKLNETSEKILFVVNKEKKLLGTLTDGDIRTGLINGMKFSDTIEEIMYSKFTAVQHDIPDIKQNVRNLMLGRKIEQIPVLSNEGRIMDVYLWTDLLGDKRDTRAAKRYENRVVVMAGGKGTRLDPFTRILPKPLIPIGNKPIIELIMESFYRYGFYRFTYTLNFKKDYIKLFLKENKSDYNVDWVEEDDFCGTAGSLSLLRDTIKDTFFLTNCDSLLAVDYEDVLTWHKMNQAAITIIGCHNEIKIPFGVLQLNNGVLDTIIEKPVHDMIINTGVYVMEPNVIRYIKENDHMDMTQLIEKVAHEEKVVVYPIYGDWVDIGQWEEYKKSVEQFGGIS